MCGFHFKSLPKVWRTMIKPGVKFMDLFCLKNIRETTLFTAWKRQSSTELAVDGEDTVPVDAVDELKGHGGSALHGVQVPTGGAEAAVAAERNEFQFAAVGTAIHCTTKGRIAAVDHLINIFDD